MNIGPDKYTDAELEAMTMGQLSKLFANCESWATVLKMSAPEWLEYCALGGRVWAIIDRRWRETEREMKKPDGSWKEDLR